ncbi:hypothetical protein Taro_054876 [Colocasia esculenta]|uniref:Uncharacterized protein n=1 Tax=Colocasia esculenta TaxID=4460 RepID=A0A843XRW6_COLES|nr:hypothetical protein [Colocasia esculenta]
MDRIDHEIATGSYEDHDRSVKAAARMRWGIPSRSDRDRALCRDGLENATYRAVTFSGSMSVFKWEKDRASDCGIDFYNLIQGDSKLHN